jgi:hypothetical protein
LLARSKIRVLSTTRLITGAWYQARKLDSIRSPIILTLFLFIQGRRRDHYSLIITYSFSTAELPTTYPANNETTTVLKEFARKQEPKRKKEKQNNTLTIERGGSGGRSLPADLVGYPAENLQENQGEIHHQQTQQKMDRDGAICSLARTFIYPL